MSETMAAISLPLFVPGDRPERFAKAAAAGADAVIVDLEDAVAPDAKPAARSGLAAALAALPGNPVLVLRINAETTEWHGEDLAAAARLPLAAVLLPKAQSAASVSRVARATGHSVLALIETAEGLHHAEEIAGAAARIAFGSLDFAADLGMGHSREALLAARSRLVLASRLAGRPAPLDGVTPALRDDAIIEDDCAYAAMLGFTGKLLIHPAQIAAARRGFAPRPDDLAWARRVEAAISDGTAAAQLDGEMIDAPVIARARSLLARAAAASGE